MVVSFHQRISIKNKETVLSHLKYGIRDVSGRKKDAYVNTLISIMKSTPMLCAWHVVC